MNQRIRLLSAWSGVAFFSLWGTGLELTGWIVPMNPSYDAKTVATLVHEKQLQILFGVATGWLIFITGIGHFILQYSALAIAIFSDKRENPAFPRWAEFLQIWISISFVPAVLPFFQKTGPFAWNGIFV